MPFASFYILALLLFILSQCQLIQASAASERVFNHSDIPGIEVFHTYAQFRIIPIDSFSSIVFQEREVLPIMTRFDWVIYGFGKHYLINNSMTCNPRTVLFRPYLLGRANVSRALSYLSVIPPLDPSEERSIVFAGSDDRLSTIWAPMKTIIESRKFSRIWYEAKDVNTPDVLTIPMGLTPYYLLSAGFKTVAQAIAESRNITKKHWVCAAWGRFSPFLDEKLPTRIELTAFTARSKWITRVQWTPTEYWQNLAFFRFSLTPEGMGVQSPKLFECMLLRTIPITNRHPAAQDLQKLGLPIVVVDSWEVVSKDFLVKTYADMAMDDTKWEEVRRKITVDGIMKLILDGEY